MNLPLLKEILSLQAESLNPKEQLALIYAIIKLLPTDTVATFDSYGNCYLERGSSDNFPCVVAHVDQVHDTKEYFKVMQDQDVLFAWDGNSQTGVGGDDKVGIYMLVECFRKYPDMKGVLFLDEEVGCIGSSKCNLEFFSDCSMILQADRRGDTLDFISRTNGTEVLSEEFKDAVLPILLDFGYEFNRGSITDVGELVNRGVGICCANVSCGYYYAHSDQEIVVISEVGACLDLFCAIFDNMAHKSWEFFPAKEEVKSYNYGQWADIRYLNIDGSCEHCENGLPSTDTDTGFSYCDYCYRYL